jgi:tetratricopeptide (TPR) repeat protein
VTLRRLAQVLVLSVSAVVGLVISIAINFATSSTNVPYPIRLLVDYPWQSVAVLGAASILLAVGGFLASQPPDSRPRIAPVLFNLPARPTVFVGRRDEEKVVGRRLRADRRSSGCPSVIVISGPGGIGKTTLSLVVAHREKKHYDGNIVFVDATLRPSAAPSDTLASQILTRIGHSTESGMGPVEAIRSILSTNVYLVILDNVGSEEQVRALVPAVGGSTFLITSREALGGIADSVLIPLGPLAENHSRNLVRTLSGRGDVPAEDASLRSILSVCDGLPLALRICGGILKVRSHWSLATLAEKLSDSGSRLQTLRIGDLSVTTTLSASFQQLTPSEQVLVVALSTFPDIFYSRALIDWLSASYSLDHGTADSIVDRQLLTPVGDDYYRVHNLVSAHASEHLSSASGGSLSRMDLLRSYAEFYVQRLRANAEAVEPHDREGVPLGADVSAARSANLFAIRDNGEIEARVQQSPHVGAIDLQVAMEEIRWLGLEHQTCLDLAEALLDLNLTDIAGNVLGGLRVRSIGGAQLVRLIELIERWELVRPATTQYRTVFDANYTYGLALRKVGSARRAVKPLFACRRLALAQGDIMRLAIVEEELGQNARERGLDRASERLYALAGNLFCFMGWPAKVAGVLNNLSTVVSGDRSMEMKSRAVAMYSVSRPFSVDDLGGAAWAMQNYGGVLLAANQLEEALEWNKRALSSFEALRDAHGIGYALKNLAENYKARGNLKRATLFLDQSKQVFEEVGDFTGLAQVRAVEESFWRCCVDGSPSSGRLS